MKAAFQARFAYLHDRLHSDFGDTAEQSVWIESGAEQLRIPVLQAVGRPARREMAGLVTMGTDTVVLYAKRADWPAERMVLDALIRLGPPSAEDELVPADTARHYRLARISDAPVLDWWRVEVELHV